jgi:hypothetical protein
MGVTAINKATIETCLDKSAATFAIRCEIGRCGEDELT